MLFYTLVQVGQMTQLHLILFLSLEDFDVKPGVCVKELDVQMKGPLAFVNSKARAEKDFYAHSDEKLSIVSNPTTHHHANGYYQYMESPTELECTKGSLTAIGDAGYEQRAAAIEAAKKVKIGSTKEDAHRVNRESW